MISKSTARLMNILPEKAVTFLSRKFIDRTLKKHARITIEGSEHLNGIQRPTLFVCNHLSNSDGLVLNKVLKDFDPTFVAGVKLSKDAVTKVGISVVKTTNLKPNSADVKGLKRIIKLIEQGESIMIFPEGTRSRAGSLIEAKKGILLIVRKTGVPIVPIGIHGTEVLLPIDKDGHMSSEKFQDAEVHISIGQQFVLPEKAEGQDKKDYEESSVNHIMRKIADLIPEAYRGVYK